eukprot:SAG11_NODE_1633_length_4542_cov_4.532298_1_plen_189_part_00
MAALRRGTLRCSAPRVGVAVAQESSLRAPQGALRLLGSHASAQASRKAAAATCSLKLCCGTKKASFRGRKVARATSFTIFCTIVLCRALWEGPRSARIITEAHEPISGEVEISTGHHLSELRHLPALRPLASTPVLPTTTSSTYCDAVPLYSRYLRLVNSTRLPIRSTAYCDHVTKYRPCTSMWYTSF